MAVIKRAIIVILIFMSFLGAVYAMGERPKEVVEKARVEEVEGKLAQKVKVEASSFKFIPNKIMVKKGIPVQLIVTNVQGSHNIEIHDLELEKDLPINVPTALEFIPEEMGELVFYCEVFGHRARGMEGKIIVEK